MADLRLLTSTATSAAATAVARVRQPQRLRGTVTAVNVGTVTVRLVGAATDVDVYDLQGAAVRNDVLIEFRPGGEAYIVEIIS